jgi:hypothetical protein
MNQMNQMNQEVQEIENLQFILAQKRDELELKDLEICRLEEMVEQMARAHSEFFEHARKQGKCPEAGFIAPRPNDLVTQSSLMYVPILWSMPFVSA